LKLSMGSASSSSSTFSTTSTLKVAPTFALSTTSSKPKEARIGRGNGRGCRRMSLGTVRHGRRGLQLSLLSSASELRVISNSLGTCSCVGAGTLVLPLEGGGVFNRGSPMNCYLEFAAFAAAIVFSIEKYYLFTNVRRTRKDSRAYCVTCFESWCDVGR
jgi:hypothetical protein